MTFGDPFLDSGVVEQAEEDREAEEEAAKEVGAVARGAASVSPKRESSFIDNLLVRIHLIIVMISVDRPCAMGV